MAYAKKRSIVNQRARLLGDYLHEAKEESGLWNTQIARGEWEREKEKKGQTAWNIVGTALAYFLPIPGVQGNAAVATAIGTGVGNVYKYFNKAEDTGFLTEDVGKWETGQIEDVKQYNRNLSAYDKKEFWAGIQDTFKSSLVAFDELDVTTKMDDYLKEKRRMRNFDPESWTSEDGWENILLG